VFGGSLKDVKSSPIAVLVTGDPVPATRARRGGFLELIQSAAPDFAAFPWRAYDVRERDVTEELTEALAVIVTGSPLSVIDRLPWMELAAERLRELVRAEVPLLGICFGHQLLGYALGGRVSLNPRGREMGTVGFANSVSDPVLGKPGSWLVNTTHLDSVVQLPPGAEVLGSTELEPYAAVRFGRCAWGVQFHPEIDGAVMREYIAARREPLVTEGFDVASLEGAAQDAPQARAVIERFLHLAGDLRGG
jgi:GMP synthase (glutamine-hydrolysing)